MNIALVLFALGIIMIVSGYTNQVSPKCDQDIKVKIVPRNVFDEIAENSSQVDHFAYPQRTFILKIDRLTAYVKSALASPLRGL